MCARNGVVLRHVVSAKQFDVETVMKIFSDAKRIKETLRKTRCLNLAKDRILTTVFLEPSTRTRLSFVFAMKRLGGEVVDFGPEEITSRAKGESFEDTMRMLDGYSPDIVVLRSREVGAAEKASKIVKCSIINAGDGWNEHPTQALLDVFTMWEIFGKIDGLKVGIMGDLKYGRTPSSLSFLLSKFKGVIFHYIAPPPLQIREDVLKELQGRQVFQHSLLEDVTDELDVLYVTRLQKERFTDQRMYEELKGSYVVTAEKLRKLKKTPIVMHPLPRVDELSTDVDYMPEAKYFQQAENGVYVRAALIAHLLGLDVSISR